MLPALKGRPRSYTMGFVVYTSWGNRRVTLHDADCPVLDRDSPRFYSQEVEPTWQRLPIYSAAYEIAEQERKRVGAPFIRRCRICWPTSN